MRNEVPHPRSMFTLSRSIAGMRALLLGPSENRLRVNQEILRVLASVLSGNYVGDAHKIWRNDREFLRRFRSLSPHNYFSEERKYALRELARSVADLEGAVAECGCYVGVSSWFVADALPDVDFYLFDSFEGLSEPTPFDVAPDGMRNWKAGDLRTAEHALRANLSDFDRIHVMKGWIPSRFEEVGDRCFRLVHIDVDLYQPTLDSLEFFYERMVPGGIIVMDDFGYENCPGAYKAANEFMSSRREHIIHLPTGQGLIIRRG